MMSFPRRPPSRIALELLDCIDEKEGKASKWDLIKILGNESQFQHWVTNFLVKDRFIKEIQEANRSFYCKTENGEFFHRLLKNGKIVQALLRVSGKRLRRGY
jgi:predicted transcriptional regulator